MFCVVIIHVGVNYINNITIGLFQSCDLHKGCEEIQITNDTLQKENIPPLTWLLISIVKMTAFSLETVSVYEQQEFDVTLCFFNHMFMLKERRENTTFVKNWKSDYLPYLYIHKTNVQFVLSNLYIEFIFLSVCCLLPPKTLLKCSKGQLPVPSGPSGTHESVDTS